MFKQQMTEATYVALFIAALSVIGNVVQSKKLSEIKLKPASTEYDKPYIDAAAFYWAKKTHDHPNLAMRERYAKVMYIGGDVCVSLEIDLGGVGGVPVYCFDQTSRRLTRKYDDVE